MSNRKKPATPAPGFQPSMSVVPSIYCDQYEFAIDGSLIGIRFGRRGETHADVTISLNLILDLANKVQERVIAATKPPAAEDVSGVNDAIRGTS